jgi:hypothetical protein
MTLASKMSVSPRFKNRTKIASGASEPDGATLLSSSTARMITRAGSLAEAAFN